ncbi:DUF3549 family protein [Microbulbifer sp. SAOS-129_SWC]|uniref:DUF3549 family protein n=1 Tax=Microbulbifer sp. SAOS-129_SWC TaxID=3145235 RepID=UPI0032174CAA
MQDSGSLAGLIAAADFNLHWFDLGRRVQSVASADATAFEAGRAPWPHPYLRQAWTGLLLEPRAGGEPVVWFLRLPLDEQGKLQLAVRDAFVHLLIDKLGHGDGAELGERLHSALQESGIAYTPAPERQATFHARVAQLLQRPPSEHFDAVLEYCRAPQSHRWDQLAVQGIADLAVRWKEHQSLLCDTLEQLAPPVFIGLCQCLESEAIDAELAGRIIDRADAAPGDSAITAAAVRGLSLAPAAELRRRFLTRLLQGEAASNSEVIAAIGSRCSSDLEHGDIAAAWLAAMAEHQSQDTFNLLLSDLMFLPAVRAALLDALRDPARPEILARAFGHFLHGPNPPH